MKERIYISGKITGLDINRAHEYFEQAETLLAKNGYIPVNPMKLVPYHPDHTWEHYMAEDIKAIMTCQSVFLLDNWQDSKGARCEHAFAKELGLTIYYPGQLVLLSNPTTITH